MRVPWIDEAKGLAIILVVFGHTWRGVSKLIPPAYFEAVDERIYAFHMPVFFALSGLFYTKALTGSPPVQFIRTRITRLIWPMLVWTYVFLIMKWAAGPFQNKPLEEGIWVLPFPGILHLWFLWALFLLNIFFMLARPFASSGRLRWSGLLILIALVTAFKTVPRSEVVTHWIGAAAAFSPFFLLGVILGHLPLERRPPLAWGVAAAAGFAALLAIYPSVSQADPLRLICQLLLTTFFLLAVAAFARPSQWLHRGLIYLGTVSMAIYVNHTIFSAAFRERLYVLGVRELAVHLVFGVVIGILGGVCVERLARATGTSGLLGLRG